MLTNYNPSHISLAFAVDDPTTLGHIPSLVQAPLETDLCEWQEVLAQLNANSCHTIGKSYIASRMILEAQRTIQALEVHLAGSRVRLVIALRAHSKDSSL